MGVALFCCKCLNLYWWKFFRILVIWQHTKSNDSNTDIWSMLHAHTRIFCGKLDKPCHHATTAPSDQPASLQVLSTNPHNFNKTAYCSHDCPLRHKHHHWSLVYWSMPLDLWSRPKQYLPGILLSWWIQVAIEFSTGVPPSTLLKRCISSLFIMIFCDNCKNVLYLTKFCLLDAKLIYWVPSTYCCVT